MRCGGGDTLARAATIRSMAIIREPLTKHDVAGQHRLAEDRRATRRPSRRRSRGCGPCPPPAPRRQRAARIGRRRPSMSAPPVSTICLPNCQCSSQRLLAQLAHVAADDDAASGGVELAEQLQRRLHRRGIRVVAIVDDRRAPRLDHFAPHRHGLIFGQGVGHRLQTRSPTAGRPPRRPAPQSRGGVPRPAGRNEPRLRPRFRRRGICPIFVRRARDRSPGTDAEAQPAAHAADVHRPQIALAAGRRSR